MTSSRRQKLSEPEAGLAPVIRMGRTDRGRAAHPSEGGRGSAHLHVASPDVVGLRPGEEAVVTILLPPPAPAEAPVEEGVVRVVRPRPPAAVGRCAHFLRR